MSPLPAPRSPIVVMIGNPNAGKSTLFNALTGMRQTTGNYPGVTVERKQGELKLPDGRKVRVLDLPGTYSLLTQTPDEEIVFQTLAGSIEKDGRPDLALVVLDASNFERNLYLALQVMDTGVPVILALNMWDAAEERGSRPDPARLAKELSVACVSTIGHRGVGITDLIQAIQEALPASAAASGHTRNAAAADRDLIAMLRAVSPEERYRQIEILVKRVTPASGAERVTVSDRIDAVVTHPVWGWVIFIGVMALIFQSIFSWASPFMSWIESGVNAAAALTARVLPDNALGSLIADGIIPGVGNVLVFLPQIFLLFFFIAVVEDFGYMSRAAFVLDRVMRHVGLNGRAFLPLLSSFACAIPGIMATRTIADRRDRLATILAAPLMSCSARLPVYTLMIGAFIPAVPLIGPFNLKGAVLLSMYALSLVAGLTMATVFKRTLLKGRQSPFIMELPPYRIPDPRTVGMATWERGKLFITNAGSVILAISIVLWFLASYPKPDQIDPTLNNPIPAAAQKSDRLKSSYAGQLGHWIEPVIEPLGFDWKIGIGLIASFAAREVLVSTLAVIYNVGDDADEHSTDLIAALRSEKDPVTGAPKYTPLVAVSLMIFFVLACQCMSTVAVVRRETGGWRWPIFMVTYMTLLAWCGSFAVYQIGLKMGWGVT
ncbi:MAG: ferrous iron transport protein B [Candidatus Omnitrophica bacterium]|nr:ferrous iron transport protein B [Candidatus Omnitrophota bacterium]